MYKVIASKSYRRDIRRLSQSGRFDIKKLEKVINMLARGYTLPKIYKNHPLKGRWSDWLLIYEKQLDVLVLYLLRTGSHSDFF